MAIDVRELHKPLRARYQLDPAAARYTYRVSATGVPGDPLHAMAESTSHAGVTYAVSVNERIGGSGTEQTPGDVLLGALAACKALSVAMVASSLRIELVGVTVDVQGELDHRGVLLMPGASRPGFETIHCDVRVEVGPGTTPEQLQKLSFASEVCCAVTDTIRNATPLETSFEVVQQQRPDASAGASARV